MWVTFPFRKLAPFIWKGWATSLPVKKDWQVTLFSFCENPEMVGLAIYFSVMVFLELSSSRAVCFFKLLFCIPS
jgi:hypothetical protein